MQELNNMPERWCSTKEMCDYLGVSRDTLLAWINEKNMPASKVGRSWKFKTSEVDEWIKKWESCRQLIKYAKIFISNAATTRCFHE